MFFRRLQLQAVHISWLLIIHVISGVILVRPSLNQIDSLAIWVRGTIRFELYACAFARLSVEKMTAFADTFDIPFDIVETDWVWIFTSRNEDVGMISSPVATLYARNAWDHDPPFGDEWRKKTDPILWLSPPTARLE